MKKILSAILLTVMSLSSNAQKEGLNAINKNDLQAYMLYFASDQMKGRETGTPLNDLSSLYIKTNIMRIGLRPDPSTGEYFQEIPLISEKINKKETLFEIVDLEGKSVLSTDSMVVIGDMFKSMNISGDAVFIGYGYTDSVTGYNDLSGVDITDKIVLMMTRNPEMVKSGSDMLFINNEAEMMKIMSVAVQRPKAIVYVYDPANPVRDIYASGLTEIIPSSNVTIAGEKETEGAGGLNLSFITRNAADAMLKNTGASLEMMQEKISSTGKPVSVELTGITVKMKTVVEKTYIKGHNVIGILEGSDPVLKNECVVYTAHYDHVGVNDQGEIYNGADDNASGSMGLLEIAEAFMSLKKKPLRTIVFAWVDGEEKGLLGSQYYTENPTMPMEKTILNINLDMIGRSELPCDTGKLYGFELNVTQPGEIQVFNDLADEEVYKMMTSAALKTGIKITDMGKEIEMGASDHESFWRKGVPAFCFHSGIHADLHSPQDDVDKIDFDKMERVSELAFLFGLQAASQRK